MFEGFYGRRRLKNVSMLFLGFLILLALFYRKEESKDETSPASFPVTESITPAPPSALLKKPAVMSSIEFTNSPYLVLRSFPSNTVPFMVLSRAANVEVRDAIRRTWGFSRSYRGGKLRIKTFFLVGTDDLFTERIRTEQNVFDDVIQVTVPDMYSFSAHKELSAMMWVRSYLPNHPFYFKAEENAIINMKVLVESFLPMIESVHNREMIIGWFGTEHNVPRGAYQRFIDSVMPAADDSLNYAINLLYVITASAADRMLEKLHHVELIEYPGDPFVTGILRDAAYVQMGNLGGSPANFTYNIANGQCDEAFTIDPDLLVCTSSLHGGSLQSMPDYFNAWNVLIGETL